MPSAGAIIPPTITPLRQQIPGRPANHINSSTYIELETDTPECKIYFSTDGSKPNPFQLKVGGRETTFKYKGSFSLKPGKRTIKVVAVSRCVFSLDGA
ncbi:hypothetical protein CAPTEDRAFT_123741 [Capitella teleta]|uniref:Uncharacterized protein n=1 Tax=Capitella teleta TaxID=283909 RepID=R7U3B2_CAPTE|nr:hypothetical protein CAPTEDRAFT_123741 [Capitella teleta]|eukprot:ELU00439.1 hypothetical protein CAPTEDRAFT_123741 [Capitella teleta]